MLDRFENLEDFESAFKSATDERRWRLVIANQHLNIIVNLDNDNTTISCNDEEDFYLQFKNDVGNRAGIFDLFASLNVKAERV